MEFEQWHMSPPLYDYNYDHGARYKAGRRRAGRRLQNHPHTIIMDMFRETAQSQEAVLACPEHLRLGRDATPAAAPRGTGPFVYRTGDCMYMRGHGQWYWAIDEVLFDHRYKCFVARYMDGPPAYLSRVLAAWAIKTWTWPGIMATEDRSYAEWLAWNRCKPWQDVVAGLESHGVVAAGAAEHLFGFHHAVFEAPESPGWGAPYARLLSRPHKPAEAHHLAGARHGRWPPAEAAAFPSARVLVAYPAARPPAKAVRRLQAQADHGRVGCPAARPPAKVARMRGIMASLVGAMRCARSSPQEAGAAMHQGVGAPC